MTMQKVAFLLREGVNHLREGVGLQLDIKTLKFMGIQAIEVQTSATAKRYPVNGLVGAQGDI